MPIMRTNPLPPGRYWVDVFDPKRGEFRGWLADHSDTVHVVHQEDKLPRDDYPAETWYLFEVLAPTPWEGPGFPTIADDSVKASVDTSDRPAPPPSIAEQTGEVIDSVEAAAKSAEEAAKTGLWGVVLLGVGVILYKILS